MSLLFNNTRDLKSVHARKLIHCPKSEIEIDVVNQRISKETLNFREQQHVICFVIFAKKNC